MARLHGLLALLFLAVLIVPSAASPVDLLTMLAASAVALLLVWSVAGRRLAPRVQVLVRALRARAWRSAFLRTRDPDADGRVRPRAPGQCPAAA